MLKPSEVSIPVDINALFAPRPSKLSLEEKIALVNLIGEEINEKDELKRVLSNTSFPICYDGFEPSGRMHIA